MDPLRRQIVEILRARRDHYVRLVEALLAEGSGGGEAVHRRAEANQMVDGVLALLTEALDGGGSDVRAFYLETMIPSLVASGRTPAAVIAGAVRFSVVMIADASGQMPAESREAAVQWFARFYGDYVADLASVAFGAREP
jgi:hypothetical protein